MRGGGVRDGVKGSERRGMRDGVRGSERRGMRDGVRESERRGMRDGVKGRGGDKRWCEGVGGGRYSRV